MGVLCNAARADTINIQHIGTAFSSVYTESAAAMCMKELPLQQTVALATLVTIQQKQDVTLGKVSVMIVSFNQ